ncbi:MAG: NfeD family protein, partial [Vulcanimicrobiota bacterium]
MKRIIFILLLIFLCNSFVRAFPEKEQPVDVIEVKGPIFTSTVRYIERGIEQAEKDQAICIIKLDTPGGLVSSMREIIQVILASEVPVVVYVAPHGAMATSAGTYITYSAHLAAMAPGTHIGSAHPVALGGENIRRKKDDEDPFKFDLPTEEGKEKETEKIEDKKTPEKEGSSGQIDVGMEKATNAMVALIRSLAEKTGRNADWGEQAVRESVSITATEAVRIGVVEIQAEDLRDLLEQIKGREVMLMGKKVITLYPSQDNIKYISMTGIEKFLLTLNEPQIALILMFLGTMGLYYELSNPGAAIPGIVGCISIILGLYTLGSLPINYTGLALIVLSAILFIAEFYTPTFGALTLGGV